MRTRGNQSSLLNKIQSWWVLTVLYWQSKEWLEASSAPWGSECCCVLRSEEKRGCMSSFHFLDLCLCVHTEIKSAQPLFLARIRTTPLNPNPYDPSPPPSKTYLKTCCSKLYLSFIAGGRKYWWLANGKLAEVRPMNHLSEREFEK